MLSLEEIIHSSTKPEDLDPDKLEQEKDLLEKVNKVRAAYGKAMTVTSGVRTLKEHLAIYAKKGITDQSKIPMKSHHLETVTDSAAVDIADGDGKIKDWVKNNVSVLEDAELWCEDFGTTTTWIHFQNTPPKSGNRFFKP